MDKHLKESSTPVLVNNLVLKTKRLGSSSSTRSIGSPIDTFLETQKMFLKNQNVNTTSKSNLHDDSYTDEDESEERGNTNQTEIEPRVSISESCISSDSDSEDFDQSNTSLANNGYNTHSPMSMITDTKSHSNLHLMNEANNQSSQRNSIYKSTFSTSNSSLDTDENKHADELDHLIEDNEHDDEGAHPSAGNYLSGIKGSGSTVARTTSISQSTRPIVENIEQAIVSRASPLHKYKNRSRSFNSGLVQKQRRSSSSNLEKASFNHTGSLLSNDPQKGDVEESGNLLKKINSLTRKSIDHPEKKSHLRNQVYPLKTSSQVSAELPSYQKHNHATWRTDKDGVPLLVEKSQSTAFLNQFCVKFHSYMEMESIPNLERNHELYLIKESEFDKDEYTKFMEYPTSELLEMMSRLLTKVVHTNDNLVAEKNNYKSTLSYSNGHTDPTLMFRGQNIPSLPINKYLQRAHHYCATSNDVYLSLLVYFDRLSQPDKSASGEQTSMPKLILDSYNIHRLIITAFTVATKFSQDIYFTNKRYAKVGGISDNELNKLELVFLDLMNWERLSCTGPELLQYWSLLNNFWERESS